MNEYNPTTSNGPAWKDLMVTVDPPNVHYPKAAAVPPRGDVLNEAINLITGDRNAQYGEPTADFQRTAAMWETYLQGTIEARGHLDVQPHDVAVMQILLKVSRLCWSPAKRDHWADIAGYAGCGYECTVSDDGSQDHH
jgi:hypothetical protein